MITWMGRGGAYHQDENALEYMSRSGFYFLGTFVAAPATTNSSLLLLGVGN